MYVKITAPPEGLSGNRWLPLTTTNEQHHAMKCISSSGLKDVAQGYSLFNFHNDHILKNKSWGEVNDNFRIGTLAHLAVLEPEKFEQAVVVCDLNQATNDFKAFKVELAKSSKSSIQFDKDLDIKIENTRDQLKYFTDLCPETDPKIKELQEELDILLENKAVIEENKKPTPKPKKPKVKDEEFKIHYTKDGGLLNADGEEKFIIKSEEMKMYRAFQKNIANHRRIPVWLNECVIEQSGVAQCPETGLWLSVRGDARSQRGLFLDPKTIGKKLSRKSIQQYIVDYCLPIQLAHYIYVANLIEPGVYKKFFFIMMSKVAPYEISLVQLDKEDVAWAVDKHMDILRKIAKCEATGIWPTLDEMDGTGGITIKLPPWGRN